MTCLTMDQTSVHVLDHLQQDALSLAIRGHNLLVTGQAGCGKSFLIRQIVNSIRSQGKGN